MISGPTRMEQRATGARAGRAGRPDYAPDDATVQPVTRLDVWFVVATVVVTLPLRFITTSPLWLDEALSVNIARLPVGDLLEALRHDGHPPLYYLLLHGWMEVVGEGDAALRALSGVLAVVTLPVAYVAGRRRAGPAGGLAVLFLVAVAPFSLRYATEVRMYSLLTLLVFVAWLLADDLRVRPDRVRWAALAVVAGAGLLTHYWMLFALAAAGAVLGWCWWRRGQRALALRIGSALAAGSLLFLPWMGSFLHQVRNTGTPWGAASRPTRAVVDLAVGLGGRGANPEAILFGAAVLVLALLGLTAVRRNGSRLEIDLRTRPLVRAEVVVASLILAIGLAAGALTAATFMPRYAAVFLPFVFIAAGAGLAQLPGPVPRRVVAVGLLVLASVGIALNVIEERSQGEQFASFIAAHGGTGDVVAFCPDQLGPSTLRYLPDDFRAAGIPTLRPPERIDWVDYADRNRSADPGRVVADLLDMAGGATIWLVFDAGYRTYEDLCPAVLSGLAAARPANTTRVSAGDDVEEDGTLLEFAG